MSVFYGATHRELQDEHGTRKLADRLEEHAHTTFEQSERDFIAGLSMAFVTTVDERGQPTVSYKGGAPGFVRVTGPSELVFPNYDGNGMFMTLGNIALGTPIGLLFIDFERPHRLRVHGTARITKDAALTGLYPGADCVVQVAVSRIFVNCGRYIHQSRGTSLSPHVPDERGRQPFPAWKRLDVFDGALPPPDERHVAEAGGTISFDEYRGESTAEKAPLPQP